MFKKWVGGEAGTGREREDEQEKEVEEIRRKKKMPQGERGRKEGG